MSVVASKSVVSNGSTVKRAESAAAVKRAAEAARINVLAEARAAEILSAREAEAEAQRLNVLAEAEKRAAAAREAAAAEARRPLAQRNGEAVFAYLSQCAASPLYGAGASLYCAVGGDIDRAAELLTVDGKASALLPYVHMAAEARSVLAKCAPRDFFADLGFTNAGGARIGDLHASTLGLSPLWRADNRSTVKSAREAARPLVEKTRKAK